MARNDTLIKKHVDNYMHSFAWYFMEVTSKGFSWETVIYKK